MGDMASELRRLRLILGFTITSTLIHYTHNFLAIEDYPSSKPFSDGLVKAGILISWPLFTAAGLIAYRWYRAGAFPSAQYALLGYSPLGLLTLGHFLNGNPDIPPVFYATIFTDFLGALAVIGFAIDSLRRHRSRPSGPQIEA